MKTYVVKGAEIEREWFVVDAAGKNLGRLATRIATILRGKHKPTFTPGLDVGDFVIVINADKIAVTGNKLTEKMYYRHSLYPGGLTETSMSKMLATHPERVIEEAVRGMLPKNRLGRAMFKKLKVYAGGSPTRGRKPQPLSSAAVRYVPIEWAMAKEEKKLVEAQYYAGTGRRKAAVARVRIYPGGSAFVVNEKPAEEFFSREGDMAAALEPFKVTGTEGGYGISVVVKGGGVTGQAEAIRHGAARALLVANPELRLALKKAGLLTRDPRAKERKKPGLKRARKAPQYTKR